MKWKNLNKFNNQIEELRIKKPYEILQVNPDSTIEEIKKAYRKLSKIYHPDISDNFLVKNNEEILKIINDAYAKIMSARIEK